MLIKAGFSSNDIELLKNCLVASRDGPFFDEEEFRTLFGIDKSRIDDILDHWPEVDLEGTEVYLALNNSLNNLIGYPHGLNEKLQKDLGVTSEHLDTLFKKWCSLTKSP